MRSYGNDIYMLNESLLDTVEADKVSDDDGLVPVIEYTFMFYFNSDMVPKKVTDTFFGSAIEPALGMMKSRGILESWDFDRTNGRIEDFPVIGLFMDCMYGKSAYESDTPPFVLSLAVRFPESEESTETLGTVSAVLMRYALASGIGMDGNMMESFWRTGGGQVYSVFHDINKTGTKSGEIEKWVFHCGKDCVNSVDQCGTFAGCFVRTVGKFGIMKPVDDAGTRYVVYGFGKNAGGQRMYFMSSDGTCLNEFIVVLAEASNGRFLDNGLMHVVFNGRYANYLRMDGTLWLNLDYMCGDRFSEGYVPVLRVYSNGSVEGNLLDIDRKPLLDEWCFRTEGFVDGLAIVVRKTGSGRVKIMHNVVDVKGNLLFGEWYDEVKFEDADDEPDDGCKRTVARVRKSGDGNGSYVWNYVDRTGKLFFKEWLNGQCGCMKNGFARLGKRTGTRRSCNYMREDGSLVSEEWFDDALGWPECGVLAFKKNGWWRFMDTDAGDVMFGGWKFDMVSEEVAADGFRHYAVRMLRRMGDGQKVYSNLVSAEGMMCCDKMEMWSMDYVGNGLVLAGKTSRDSKELWKFGEGPVRIGREVLSACMLGDSEYTVVSSVDKYAVVDKDGKPVRDEWFDRVGDSICGGFVEVWSYGVDRGIVMRTNVLACGTGKLLFGTGERMPCRICGAVPDKVAIVEKLDSVLKYNIFDCDGNMLLDTWTDFRICATEDGRVLRVGPSAYVDCSGKTVSLI